MMILFFAPELAASVMMSESGRPSSPLRLSLDLTVQRAMGHKGATTTTLNTYSHLWPKAEDRTRKAAEANAAKEEAAAEQAAAPAQ